MYKDFYNLTKEPFQVTPDPEFLFLSPGHREALASILYGMEQRKGFIELVGEVGVGKTTTLRYILDRVDRKRLKPLYVFHPALTFPGLLKYMLRELGIRHESDAVEEMIHRLHRFLIEEYRCNRLVVLIIDEAQNASIGTLESLRMLSNLESSKDKLLQIVLCGQPELDRLLRRGELRQLRQRIAVRATIQPLSRYESRDYIRHRLALCGRGDAGPFSDGALKRIVRQAKGIPRTINVLCDNALISGFGYQERTVSSRTAKEVIGALGGRDALSLRNDVPWKWVGAAVLPFLLVAVIYAGFRMRMPDAEERSLVAQPVPVSEVYLKLDPPVDLSPAARKNDQAGPEAASGEPMGNGERNGSTRW